MSGYAFDAQIWCEDCVPADTSGCECGSTDHNPQCAPLGPSETEEAEFCGECGVCVASGVAERELLLDSASGIYIPQRWATECASTWRGYDPNDVTTLLQGPDHEWYWDAWDAVLNSAECILPDGKIWTLEQEDDLFAVRLANEGDGKLVPHPYALRIDAGALAAIEFAAGRYEWATVLGKLVSYGCNRLTEPDAWALNDALDADDAWAPCLDPGSELAAQLQRLQNQLV